MKNTIAPLFELQSLEAKSPNPEEASEIQRLRKKVIPQILAHYDRLRARGKRGVALVRNGVCAECHMRLSSGTYATLLRAEDIMICDNCGRYLYQDPAAVRVETPEQSAKAKTAKVTKPRRKKADPTPEG
jgi:predicted  nucleic acid-binding Zn-ribbon protein